MTFSLSHLYAFSNIYGAIVQLCKFQAALQTEEHNRKQSLSLSIRIIFDVVCRHHSDVFILYDETKEANTATKMESKDPLNPPIAVAMFYVCSVSSFHVVHFLGLIQPIIPVCANFLFHSFSLSSSTSIQCTFLRTARRTKNSLIAYTPNPNRSTTKLKKKTK